MYVAMPRAENVHTYIVGYDLSIANIFKMATLPVVPEADTNFLISNVGNTYLHFYFIF